MFEDSESFEQAAIREAYEETGFKVKLVRKFAEYINLENRNVDSHDYEGKMLLGKYLREYSECESEWFKINSFPKEMAEVRKMMIQDCIKNSDKLIIRNSPRSIF